MTRADMARVANPVPRCTSAANEGANLSMASLETVIRKHFLSIFICINIERISLKWLVILFGFVGKLWLQRRH